MTALYVSALVLIIYSFLSLVVSTRISVRAKVLWGVLIVICGSKYFIYAQTGGILEPQLSPNIILVMEAAYSALMLATFLAIFKDLCRLILAVAARLTGRRSSNEDDDSNENATASSSTVDAAVTAPATEATVKHSVLASASSDRISAADHADTAGVQRAVNQDGTGMTSSVLLADRAESDVTQAGFSRGIEDALMSGRAPQFNGTSVPESGAPAAVSAQDAAATPTTDAAASATAAAASASAALAAEDSETEQEAVQGQRAWWQWPLMNREHVNAVIVGIAVTLGFSGTLSQLRIPEVVTQDIVIPDLPKALEGYKIVQLSDIHIGPVLKRSFLDGVVKRTNSLNPDLIVLTGDMVDGSVNKHMAEFIPLRELNPKDGILAVTGNHEYYSGAFSWVAALSELGVTFLDNESVIVKDLPLQIVGVPDSHGIAYGGSGAPDVAAALTTLRTYYYQSKSEALAVAAAGPAHDHTTAINAPGTNGQAARNVNISSSSTNPRMNSAVDATAPQQRSRYSYNDYNAQSSNHQGAMVINHGSAEDNPASVQNRTSNLEQTLTQAASSYVSGLFGSGNDAADRAAEQATVNAAELPGLNDAPWSMSSENSFNTPRIITILLSHQPNIMAQNPAVDLVLSGHTHGGTMFFLKPLIALFNYGFISGLYQTDHHTYLYVSNGTGIWSGFSCRVMVPAEITLLRLTRGPLLQQGKTAP